MVLLTAPIDPDELCLTEDAWLSPAPDETKIRRVTVPVPAEAKTSIVLLFRKCMDLDSLNATDVWCNGFRIERHFDCEPYDAIHEELPLDLTEQAEEDTYEQLGDAVVCAAERAGWWLATNSGLPDGSPICSARDNLAGWLAELSPETITESVFDDASEEETRVAADGPAEESCTKHEDAKDAKGDQPSSPSQRFLKSCEAADYEKKKARLEQVIAQVVMEQIRCKAALKQCNEALRTYGDELAELELAWNRPLPLFDQPAGKIEAEAIEVAPNVKTIPVTPDPVGVVAAVDAQYPWREKKIVDLAGLTPKIVEILDAENIRTVGDWVDFPIRRGIEYTQIGNAAGKITEKRYEKLVAAMDKATVTG